MKRLELNHLKRIDDNCHFPDLLLTFLFVSDGRYDLVLQLAKLHIYINLK